MQREGKYYIMSWKILAGVGITIIVLIGAVFYFTSPSNGPGQHDSFAKCLTEKGAKFYGAFWCSHCKNQKELFGTSMKHVKYIECSTPDGQNQLQVCKGAGVASYPTWVFADGSKQTGELSLQQLASKTGCSLIEPNEK